MEIDLKLRLFLSAYYLNFLLAFISEMIFFRLLWVRCIHLGFGEFPSVLSPALVSAFQGDFKPFQPGCTPFDITTFF